MWIALSSLLVGGAISLQAFINGQLGLVIGSSLGAAALNTSTALLIVLLIALSTGALPRAWRQARSAGHAVKIWWFFGGFIGAAAVFSTSVAAPIVGITTLMIALVFGKLLGGLVTDALGLGPAGSQGFSARRLAGAGLALTAVVVAAGTGARNDFNPLLLCSLIVVGAGVAVQQSGNAQLLKLTGEPIAMGLINFSIGAVTLVAILAMSSHGLGAIPTLPPWGWMGGALGALIGIFSPIVVRSIGALRLFLGLVAGQGLAGLVLDLIAPQPGHEVRMLSVVGILLACLGVFITKGADSRAPSGVITTFRKQESGERCHEAGE